MSRYVVTPKEEDKEEEPKTVIDLDAVFTRLGITVTNKSKFSPIWSLDITPDQLNALTTEVGHYAIIEKEQQYIALLDQ